MSDRLPRSNSQSHLPNYGQGQPDNKNTDIGNDKNGASGQSDKNTGQGQSEKNKVAPQMKSKEEKKGREPSESGSDEEGKSSGAFEKIFLGAKLSEAEKKFKSEAESSSEDDVLSHQNKTPRSPRQQQLTAKEKNINKKQSKLSLKNFGNALKSFASDVTEITVSPRKKPEETRRATQDPNFGVRATQPSVGTTTTTNTNATTANTAVGDVGLSRTTNIVEVPVWLPASPRSEQHLHTQPSQGVSVKSAEITTAKTTTTKTTATTTTTTTSNNKKNELSPKNLKEDLKKISKVPEKKDAASASAVKASLLTLDARQTIYSLMSGHIVPGEKIAELLLCMESRGYTEKLEESRVNKILRGGMTVEDLDDPDNSGEKLTVNIVELVNEAIIQKYLNAKEIEEFVEGMAGKYKKIAQSFSDEIKASNTKDLRKNKIFVDLMKPLVDSFLERFFGKEMKLSNSRFSPEFKNFLQGIDDRVIKWATACGGLEPDLLFRARKSAIAAYIGTRAITVIMRNQLNMDKNYQSDRLDILNGYLNTLLTTQIDNFYFDIMSSAENQDEQQKKLLAAHKKGSALKQRDQNLKIRREKISSDLDSDTPISPREKIKSPRKEDLEKRSEDLNATRATIRNKAVSNFIKESKIKKLDSDFLRYFREFLWRVTREQYQEFKDNPAEKMLESLKKYIIEHPGKLKSSVNFVQPMKDELQKLVDQKNKVTLAAQTTSSASEAQITLPTQIQASQATVSTVVSATQTLIAEGADEASWDDSSVSLEEGKTEGLMESQLDESVAESPTAEEETPNVPGNSAAALEKIKEAGLMKSPFDDSDSSSSQ